MIASKIARVARRAAGFAVLALALGAGGGCGKSSEKAPSGASHTAVAASPAVAAALPEGGAASKVATTDRAMRVTVETALAVRNVEEAARGLRLSAQRLGGYVSESRLVGSGDNRSGSFELRVPADKLDALRADVGGLGEIESDSEKAEDVTDQRADLGARLRNARAEEKRLLDLLADRTGGLADVMAVEKELASTREAIERLDAQAQGLEHQIAFATVKIELRQRAATAVVGPASRIGRAFGEGVETAGAFIVGLGIVLGSAGPTMLILVVLAYGAYRVVRSLVRRSRAPAPPLHDAKL